MIQLCKDIQKHARELLGHLMAGNFEQTGDGLYLPRMHAVARGAYIHDVNGEDERIDHNLVTDQGLTYLLGAGLGADAKITAWYLALFGGAVNPAANWTAANFAANASEITSGTEGYAEATRPLYSPAAASGNAIDNVATKAAFTIVTAAQLNVTGAGLLSDNAKGSTNGKLASATRFASTRVLSNGDVFNLGYRVQLAAA